MILLNLAFRPPGALFLWCKWIRAYLFCTFLSLTFSKPHNFNTKAARRPFLRPVFMHIYSFLCVHISTCAARPATNAHARDASPRARAGGPCRASFMLLPPPHCRPPRERANAPLHFRVSSVSIQLRAVCGMGGAFRFPATAPRPPGSAQSRRPAGFRLNRFRRAPGAAWCHFGFPLSFPCHLPEAPKAPSIYPAARPIAVCEKRPGDPVTWAQRLSAVSRAFRYSRP